MHSSLVCLINGSVKYKIRLRAYFYLKVATNDLSRYLAIGYSTYIILS